ncbi:MAG TPA: amino acid adenylation domain-containing protein [Pyrinomonadaceae bacterium]|nr:amino acid adenylation domain-containing protein [Pyrinomonadaceae bacterium]
MLTNRIAAQREKHFSTTPALGHPISNAQVYLLDAKLHPVPINVPGELHIAGAGVTRGYIGSPELTATSFIPNPFSVEPGTRMYRTGDLGRYLPDGSIEFLRRVDSQVKVRGFRIELGEIEAALTANDQVEQCAAVVVDDGRAGQRIVVYFVLTPEATLDVNELRAYLKEKLPAYMIPSTFVQLEALPLTSNGKLDRRALPAPGDPRTVLDESFTVPRTPVEEALAAIWAEVLGTEKFGIHDNFIDLGGHSLLATQVISRVRKVFAVELPLRVLFEEPSVTGLATVIQNAMLGGEGLRVPPIRRVERDGTLPLSYAQQRLWFVHQLDPSSAAYNVPSAFRLHGPLNRQALERSLRELVRRHEALRTTFPNVDGKPRQQIGSEESWQAGFIDLSGMAVVERETETQKLASAEASRPFDLENGPVFRAKVLALGEEDHVLLLTMHHIISDAWSVGVLLQELSSLYGTYDAGADSLLEDLDTQYVDYAIWQREWLSDAGWDKQLNYWKHQLAGAPEVLALPTDKISPAVQGFTGSSQTFSLSPEVTERLREVSRSEGVTVYMLLLAVFQTLLCRYTGQTDVVVGTGISNRNLAEVEGVIGFFLNTLVLRTDLSGNPSFSELLKRVRNVCLGAYAHQDVPFEKLVEELRPERSLSRTPLFQVMFALQHGPREKLTLPCLTVRRLQLERLITHFDLMLGLEDSEEGIAGSFEYSTELFEHESIRRMMERYQRLLEAAVANPQLRIADIPLLSTTELRQQLETWNDTTAEYPSQKCINELIEAQAQLTPEAIAVKFEGETLSYQELNSKANQLARRLQHSGVAPGVRVGVFMQHSPEEIVGLLAIIKAGGAYVPLEPAYPATRLTFIISDAQVALILTQQRMAAKLPQSDAQVVCIDAEGQQLELESDGNLERTAAADELVYVIYTSGSTGQPKGVGITHRALVNYVWWAKDVYLQNQSLATALYSSLAFDLTVTSIYVPLISGNKIVIYSWQGKEAPLDRILRDDQTGLLKLTPSHLSLIKEWDNRQTSVKRLIVGGEALGTDLARQVHESFGGQVEIYNEYGPTEATVGCMIYRFDAERDTREAVPIGRPAANVQIYVLDKWLQPAAENVTGELYIAGDGLAQAYLNHPELTAERFIPNPFVAGARMYQTGDLCRRLPGGELEYLGRRDEQVKFHGYRVELNEIQWALKKHPQVRDCVAVVTKDRHGHDVLVAYYVSRRQLEVAELRAFLSPILIEETIPNVFVHLRKLPLTLNGKINHAALPTLEEAKLRFRPGSVPARTPQEEILVGIWTDVLSVERLGIYDNFFELGGHSMLATQVISRVRQTLNVELPLRAVFESQTIAALSEKVDAAANAERNASLTPIERVARDRDLPLSFAQQRLWFLDQLNPNSAAYNIPAVLRLKGPLNIGALNQTLGEIIRRHESLRTTFKIVNGQPVQVINEPGIVNLDAIDLRALNEQERAAQTEHLIRQHTQQPFDLSSDLMLRPGLLRLREDEHILFMTMHHIVSDGWSMSILMREMATLYASYLEGEEPSLRELPIQYVDFAKWQREWLQGELLDKHLAYWQKQLEGAPTTINLPTDRSRPSFQTFESDAITFELSESLSKALKALSQQEGVTLFMTLIAAYNTLLYRYTAQEDILVGTGIANRNRTEIEGLIGFFVNMLVMRTDLSGNPSFTELLRRVREMAFGAYAHQDLPFEKLVEELQPERDLSHTPFFQVTFVLQNVSSDELTLQGLEASLVDFKTGVGKFDLVLSMTDAAKGLTGTLEYNTNLFDRATIERMLGHFQTLLESVVANPQQKIGELSILSEPEQRRLLAEWNDTRAEFPAGVCAHQLFEQQAAINPEHPAVVHAHETVSYAELNKRANQLAHYLQSLGVGPESRVGICLDRSTEMITAVLAVMKAGGAYVPLDPQYPRTRLEHMLNDSRVKVLLTQQRLMETVPGHDTQVACVDTEWETIARQKTANPSSGVTPGNLAYIIYTSGSTGKPKGALVQHRGLCNLTEAQLKAFDLGPDARTLQFASLSFDASIFEIVMAWRSGATLCLTSGETALPGTALAQLLRDGGVTHVTLPPSVLAVMPEEPLPSLRTIIVAGEACPAELVQRWATGRRFFNAYGPTETTVWATVAECQPDGGQPTIGRPIINAQIYVLDANLQPVPVGVPGELHIGGVGLARGYVNCPDLTADRFVPNAFSNEPGSRLYKTGDLARVLPNGEIDYLGRIDHQVKVRGFRIELGEIESVTAQYQGVREVVVLARSDAPGEARLVAYIVPEKDAAVEINTLRQHLSERLPEYMVPASFVILEALPLTSNGKVDRRALSQLSSFNQQSDSEYVAPRNETEQAIVAIWQEALQIEKVGIDDNFFDLGGHSLLMVSIHNKLKERFKKDLPIADLFKHPTIRRLTACLNEEAKQTSAQSIRDRAKKQKQAAMSKRLMKKNGYGKNVVTHPETART